MHLLLFYNAPLGGFSPSSVLVAVTLSLTVEPCTSGSGPAMCSRCRLPAAADTLVAACAELAAVVLVGAAVRGSRPGRAPSDPVLVAVWAVQAQARERPVWGWGCPIKVVFGSVNTAGGGVPSRQ